MKYLLILLSGIVYACSPQIRTYSDYDRNYKIQDYKTFGWVNIPQKDDRASALYYNELNDKRIKNAVNDLLRSKGYVLTEKNPSLTIDYHIIVEEQSVLQPDAYGYFYGDSFMRPRNNIFYYREGTLILDFKKTETRELIWRGWAVAAMEVIFYDTKNIDAVIHSTVAKILLKFPDSDSQAFTGQTVQK